MAEPLRKQLAQKIEEFKRKAVEILRSNYRDFEARMVQSHLSGPTGPTSLSVRTGSLRRSMKQLGPTIQGNRIRTSATIGSTSHALAGAARAHEFGAMIQGKPWLAIPLDLTKARVARRATTGTERMAGAFWIRSKRGNPLLVKPSARKGKKRSIRRGDLLLVLVRSVTLPPRLNFRREWKKQVGTIRADLASAARKAFGRAR